MADEVDRDVARALARGGRSPDPAGQVAAVNDRTGAGLTLVGAAEHGDSGGALYVRWPDGRDGVLTRTPASADRMRLTAEVLAEVRAAGLPVPRHDLIVELGGGVVAVVQERLPGSPARKLDAATIDAMAAVNERFAGLLTDRPEVPVPALRIGPDQPDPMSAARLAEHSPRTRRMLQRIREIGESAPAEIAGDDLLHPDLTIGNILYESGQVTGVVDWNWGVERGDRHFALLKIYIDLFWNTGGADQAAWDRLDALVEERIEPDRLTAYWAGLTLGQLSYWVMEDSPKAVEIFLRFGDYRL
ncbi:phosphotransferase [Microlunatus speluncae]|uniref:phosphotransferase n=1 Tax=Microlunatus speluncae TaxID=2594267 RepID=UPI0012664921|nr:phosphotransferase [Microlunatus speluncae]